MIARDLRKYLARSPVSDRWSLAGAAGSSHPFAVVIPALAESGSLPATLDSLAQSARKLEQRGLVIIVVNQRADTPAMQQRDNCQTLDALQRRSGDPFDLAWVDATGADTCLPARDGVGLARKIGLDLALERLSLTGGPWLACLDADTLVEPSYLLALQRHFQRHRAGGAVLPFRHRSAPTAEEQAAMDLYEAYLHGTALGLALAGSPYAYVSLGSAIACRAEAYVRAGGMNRRLAGEDFYFLQQLRKTTGIAPVCGTRVYPSPRLSERTPFGTGQKLRHLIGTPDAPLFYSPEAFALLGNWFHLLRQNRQCNGAALTARAHTLHPELGRFLEEAGFATYWDRLQQRKPSHQWWPDFHTWFDGLRTIRLLNHLARHDLPRGPQQSHWLPLLKLSGHRP